MFLSDVVFENVFKPAIENKGTTRIIPLLKTKYRKIWESEVTLKISSCRGSEKVSTPIWADIDENIAFIAIDSGEGSQKEADIAVWGEPFMAEYMSHEGESIKSVPRYLIHVKSDSELIYRLKDIFDRYVHKGR
jgi:hypothetical protein